MATSAVTVTKPTVTSINPSIAPSMTTPQPVFISVPSSTSVARKDDPGRGINFGSALLAVILVLILAFLTTSAAYKGKKVKAKQRKNDQKDDRKDTKQSDKQSKQGRKDGKSNKGSSQSKAPTKNNNINKGGGGK